MTTVLFLLTFVLVAYVLFVSIFGKPKNIGAEEAAPAVAEKPKAAKKAKAEVKPKAETKPKAEPKAAPRAAGNKLKNPDSGETAPIPANYRFAKRWVKEALVSEGLLDKIYKNTEIDEATDKKIKSAINKLKGMEKYHP